jgi:hypothetical protein
VVGQRGDVESGAEHRRVRERRVPSGVGELGVIVQVGVGQPLAASEPRDAAGPDLAIQRACERPTRQHGQRGRGRGSLEQQPAVEQVVMPGKVVVLHVPVVGVDGLGHLAGSWCAADTADATNVTCRNRGRPVTVTLLTEQPFRGCCPPVAAPAASVGRIPAPTNLRSPSPDRHQPFA